MSSPRAKLKTGVLLVNTGTPDEPTVAGVRAFLAEMLSDPMLVSMPRPLWNIILKRCILPRRPQRTVRAYQEMWTAAGAPFLLTSYAQRDAIAAELERRTQAGERGGVCVGELPGDAGGAYAGGADTAAASDASAGTSGGTGTAPELCAASDIWQVELTMRYGNPSIAAGLEALRAGGCGRVVLVPMYPQYVRVCAGTCLKAAHAELDAMAHATGWKPERVEVRDFYEQPAYLDALEKSVRECWEQRPGAKLIVSFHSTLLADIKDGDPYERQTRETACMLAQRLGVPDEDFILAYQSRFDNRKWLGPHTAETVEILGATGTADVCVVTPGFVADNIETCIEIGRILRESFLKEARRFGTTAPRFTRVPALNDAPDLARAVADAICDALRR